MAENVAGEIYIPRKKISVEWKVENYFLLPQTPDSFTESPIFHFLNASWCLRVYPNGRRKNKSINWVSLYLINKKSETEAVVVNVHLGVRYSDGEIYKQCNCSNVAIKRETGNGNPMFERNELFTNRNDIAPDGTVTFFLIVKQSPDVSHASSQTVSVDGTRSLSRDFHNLLVSKQKSDVVIRFILKGQEFQAHKLILEARSSVFAAMFKYDMKENASGVINVENDCDPDTFQEFLSFIYTGETEKGLSADNVFQLFTLADMYDISDLSEICIDFMKNNLALDIACNVLAVADKHNEDDLKKSAKQMIVSNMKTLLPTEQWKGFMRDNTNLATEILMTVIPDNTESWYDFPPC